VEEEDVARVLADEAELASFCRKHHIRRLSLFGSAVHGDLQPGSDLDVLVEFEHDQVPGLAFFAMETELSKILGRKVDLNTPGFLSPYFRDQVLAEAEVQYDQTEQ
jgi:predicted nucleotidyltransferase